MKDAVLALEQALTIREECGSQGVVSVALGIVSEEALRQFATLSGAAVEERWHYDDGTPWRYDSLRFIVDGVTFAAQSQARRPTVDELRKLIETQRPELWTR